MNAPHDLPPKVAKVFMSGRSQAVRLPKEFRFDTDEVTIERRGGDVILRAKPTKAAWWARMQRTLAGFQGMELVERNRMPDDREPPSFDGVGGPEQAP